MTTYDIAQECSDLGITGNEAVLLRQRRDQLLELSDWAVLPDSPVSVAQKTLWLNYRQELRDLPNNVTDYGAVEFPDAPSY